MDRARAISLRLPAASFLALALLPAMPAFQVPPRGDDPPPKTRTDLDGIPLPNEAVARMGSGRFRHGAYACRLVFLPDGKSLVSYGAGRVRVWEVATGKLTRSFDDLGGLGMAVAGSAGHLTIAGVSEGKGTNLVAESYDLTGGKSVRRVELPDSPFPLYQTFSVSDGRAALINGSFLRVYDLATGKRILNVQTLGGSGKHAILAPDSRTVAVPIMPGSLHLYDAADGKLVREFKHGKDRVDGSEFSPDGRFLASAVPNAKRPGIVILWDLTSGKELRRLPGPSGYLLYAAFAPDGKYVAVGGNHYELVLWETATGKEIRRFRTAGHFRSAAFSPDGHTLAAASESGVIRLWDVRTGDLLPASADPLVNVVHGLRFGPSGKHLFGSLNAGNQVSSTLDLTGTDARKHHAGAVGTVRAWDPALGKELRRFAEVPNDLWFVALSPDETLLAGASPDGSIRLADAATGREVRVLNGHEKFLWHLHFAPDGRQLFSSSADGTIRVWDVANGRELRKLTGLGDRTVLLAASPDGHWLASANVRFPRTAYEVVLWDLQTGKEKSRLAMGGRKPGPGNCPLQLVFSPDGLRLAAAGSSGFISNTPGEVRVWDVATEKNRPGFDPGKERPSAVAFSADGRMLAAGSDEGTLFVWEAFTGRLRHRFTGHKQWIASVAFSPDGRRLAASSADAPVYVWDLAGSFPRQIPAADLERHWKALAGTDAVAAFAAIRRLAAAPESALPFLRERLKPARPTDPEHLRKLIGQLDSPQFPEREQATAELERLAPQAEVFLRRTLREATSLEVRRRLGQVLDRLEAGPPEMLRTLRAVEALEWMGTPAATELLDVLAGGAPEAVLTREATATRDRVRAPLRPAGER
jgi:WD40 repeat protein